jgi:hypothetical protein
MRPASAAGPNNMPLLFKSAMRYGPGSRAVFRKECAAMGCARRATRDSP